MSYYIDINFDFNKLDTKTNLNNDDALRILSYYLEKNMNSKNDELMIYPKEEYMIQFEIDKNKNMNIRSNAKNSDLVCGIVLMAIDNLKEEGIYGRCTQ